MPNNEGGAVVRGGWGKGPARTTYNRLGAGQVYRAWKNTKEKEAAYHAMYDPHPHVFRLEMCLASVAPSGQTHPGRMVSQGP